MVYLPFGKQLCPGGIILNRRMNYCASMRRVSASLELMTGWNVSVACEFSVSSITRS